MPASASTPQVPNWPTIIGFVLFHIGAVGGVLYLALGGFSWATLGLGFGWYLLSGFSITGGYHRLFSHRAYRSSRLLRWFYLFFGAAAFQTSVVSWCSDHRRHHAKSDQEEDPYSVTKGFWWAHMRWMLVKSTTGVEHEMVRDLESQRSIALQHRYYLPLALFTAFLVPGLIAMAWGDFLGGVLVAGALRLTVLLHATWCINSLAHTLGTRPYVDDLERPGMLHGAIVLSSHPRALRSLFGDSHLAQRKSVRLAE